MKKEKGNILITVILMMVILLSVAIGLTSIGSGGLENSVLAGRDVETTENSESIDSFIRNGTNWATGIDKWIQSGDISSDIFGRDKLELKIFIDNKSKNINFNIPPLTSAGAIYITAIKKNIAGFSVTMNSVPAGVALSGDISLDASKNYARKITPFQSGNYNLGINNSDGEEYILFIRVFCKE